MQTNGEEEANPVYITVSTTWNDLEGDVNYWADDYRIFGIFPRRDDVLVVMERRD